MRLAVRFARQPLANRTRALAMSTRPVSTGTPTASMESTSESTGAVRPGDLPGPGDVGVHHGDELDTGKRGEDSGVMLPQVTDADDRYPQRHSWIRSDCLSRSYELRQGPSDNRDLPFVGGRE